MTKLEMQLEKVIKKLDDRGKQKLISYGNALLKEKQNKEEHITASLRKKRECRASLVWRVKHFFDTKGEEMLEKELEEEMRRAEAQAAGSDQAMSN